jgi:hypothetical protein
MAQTERRTSYDSPAEIWVDGEKRFDAVVHLNGWVEVIDVQTSGGTIRRDGATSWDGIILDGLKQSEILRLIGQRLDLHLENGNTAVAVVADAAGTLRGIRDTPF